jgi:hypothetical protein
MTQVTALWRGEIPLATTGWLYGLFGMLLLASPVVFLTGLGLAPAAKPLLLALSAATLLYAPFIAVAIWRSAGNYRGKLAWRLLAKGSVLFVALQVVVGLSAG